MRGTQLASPKSPQIKKECRAYFAALEKRVTQLRKSRGMTQADLARVLGVSQQTVFAYELGERRISVFAPDRLATLFRLNVDQFFGSAPEPVKKRGPSPRAMRHAERLQALSKTQQCFIVRIIDVLEESNSKRKPAAAAPPCS